MKIIHTAFILLTCFQFAFAQDKISQSDTSANKKSGAKQNTLFIKLQSANSYGIIKPGTKSYNFKSMFGTGAELIVGFKLYEKTALGFGFLRTKFFLNREKVDKALTERYTQPWLSASVTGTNNSSLIQKAFFIYLSAWKQNKRNVFEYYAKMKLTSFGYNLNSNVLCGYSDTNYNFSVSYEKGNTNTGLVVGAGINYSRQLSKIFYIGGGVEYNFNVTPRTYLYENIHSKKSEATYTQELPAPAHIIQLNIGFMYRPKKACNCKAQKPW